MPSPPPLCGRLAILRHPTPAPQGDAAPNSAAEYEALLLSSADSSFVWIKYMAFLISLGDIDQARAVAQRAFNAINYRFAGRRARSFDRVPGGAGGGRIRWARDFAHPLPPHPACLSPSALYRREDAEKFNVWVALLNLENTYGDEATTLSTLGRALQHTDARRMYLAAVDIFQRSEKASLLEQCCKAMSRKFSASAEVRASNRCATEGGMGIQVLRPESVAPRCS